MKYDDIRKDGYPLGFLINKGTTTNSDDLNKTFVSHTRQMALLQKETIGYEGDLNSHSWRLTSDEGKHLNGTDLAPFPLGFFSRCRTVVPETWISCSSCILNIFQTTFQFVIIEIKYVNSPSCNSHIIVQLI